MASYLELLRESEVVLFLSPLYFEVGKWSHLKGLGQEMIGHCRWNLFIFSTPTFLDCERAGHPCEYVWAVAAPTLALFLLKDFFFLRK